jgi:mediator of RNA polymerase II transcription subunit 14
MSVERILKRVIGRHVEHILSTIHDRLRTKPRFVKREAAMSLHVDRDEPMESYLAVQLTFSEKITAKIDPISGLFAMSPHSRMIIEGEARLNYRAKDPAEEGMNSIEGLRCVSATEELKRRGRSMGWSMARQPGKIDIKAIVHSGAGGNREPFQSLWFKREGWDPHWYLMISLSLSGDKWWLVEL